MTTSTHTSNKKPLAAAVAQAMEFAGFDDWFEIFEAGEQTDSKGRAATFTEADLDSIVNNHNPEDPAPLVVGHPKTNHPAFGWTSELKREGTTLFAKATDVVSEFEDAVRAKMYRKRSVSITPDGNGGYELRHIGWLGAQPPAVKGLKDLEMRGVAFSENHETTIYEYALSDAVQESAWGLDSITRMLRKMREWIISEHDIETADQVMPDYQINSLQHSVTAMNEQLGDDKRFSADNTQDSEQETGEMSNFSQDDLDKATADANERAKNAEAQLKKMQFEQRTAQAQTLVDNLVNDGKLLPAQTEGLADFMAHLSNLETSFEFSSGEDTASKTPYEFAESLLSSLGKQIQTGKDERDDADETVSNYSAPPGYTVNADRAALHQKALDYASKHNVEYGVAIQKVDQES